MGITMSNPKACVFDAYGTLFDVNAAAREVAAEPGQEAFALVWQQVALDWRLKTLQYTWLRTITGTHTDFWTITEEALDWALEASDQVDPALRATLLGLFWKLRSYPEVPGVLADLTERGVQSAILSNGTSKMLAAAVENAGIGPSLSAVLSAEDLDVYKPASMVYDLVGEALDLTPEEVLFVSSNGWDIAGAAQYGFRTLWVNRAKEPIERLAARPGGIAGDLTGLVDLVDGR